MEGCEFMTTIRTAIKSYVQEITAGLVAVAILFTTPISLAQVPAAKAPDGEKTVRLTVESGLVGLEAVNAEIWTVLKTLSEKTKVPIEIDPAVKGQVTVTFESLPLDMAIARILETIGAENTLVEYVKDEKATPADARVTRVVVLRGGMGDTDLRKEVLHLLELVGHRNDDATKYKRLLEIGPANLPLILGVLRETKKGVFFKENIAEILAQICDLSCLPDLEAERQWAEAGWSTQYVSGERWGSYGAKVRGVIAYLMANEVIVRSDVLKMEPQRQIATWTTFLNSKNDSLQQRAWVELRGFGEAAIDSLIEKVKTAPTQEDQRIAFLVLVDIGRRNKSRRVLDYLLSLIESTDQNMSAKAIGHLAELKDTTANDLLWKKASSLPPLEASNLLIALRDLGDDRPMSIFVEWLGSADEKLSRAGSSGLEKYGLKALDKVIPLLDSPIDHVRKYTVICLGEIGDRRVVPALEKLLDDPKLGKYAEFAIEQINHR